MTETPEQTDERRAREIFQDVQSAAECWGDDCETCWANVRKISSAIRASDEAAGMALVPKDKDRYREGWIAGRDAAIAEIEDHDFTHSLLPILVRGLDPPE